MSDTRRAIFDVGHPAPDRGKVRLWALLLALAAPPTVWLAQVCFGFFLGEFTCFSGSPSAFPGDSDTPQWVTPILAITTAASGLIAVASTVYAVAILKHTHTEAEEHAQSGVTEAGEGRTRYLAVWAVFSGGTCVFAIAVTALSLFLTQICL